MYRYRVIDIHPIDRLYGVIEVGHVFETDRPAALMAWDSRRPEISGYSYGFIAGETVAAIKVEDITYQKRADDKHEVEPAPWIPVSERMPESGGDVLVCDGDAMAIACFRTKDRVWNFFGRDFWSGSDVTHWMPLPEPPQK